MPDSIVNAKCKTKIMRRGRKDCETQTKAELPLPPFIPQDVCCRCSKPHTAVSLRCTHCFCAECARRICRVQLNDRTAAIRCPICLSHCTETEVQKMNPEIARVLDQRASGSFAQGQLVRCPKCDVGFLYEPGSVAGITKDQQGEDLSPQALECLRKNRCTCVKCQTVFCVACHRFPYHEAFTCEEQQLIDDGITCRFCARPVVGGQRQSPAERICGRPECREALQSACMHVIRECGHACSGIRGEKDHFGCAECGYDQCCVCGDECMKKPSIKLMCGHAVHLECARNQYLGLKMKGRVFIPCCAFAGCHEIPDHPVIHDLAKPWYEISEEIREMTTRIMSVENIEQEKNHVNNPHDRDFYKQPLKYAQSIFVFFFCDKCHKPYYGGHAECGGADDPNGHYTCPRCSCEFVKICPKHGEGGMRFKCFFCCRDALFRCFGTPVYFCDVCHRDAQGTMNKQSFPPCDPKTCVFAPHPPNGERTVWGFCQLCQAEKEAGKS